MTPTQRKAMEQALDYIRSTADYKMGRPAACETADDLSAALAEQPAEPVAFSQFLTDVVTAAGLLSHGKTDKTLAARISEFACSLRTAPQSAEPVAWMHEGTLGRYFNETYEWALGKGIAKEQARALLPEGLTPSRLYMNGTLRSWIHYLKQRMDPSTQKEHRLIAEQVLAILRTVAPITMQAFFPE